MRTIRRQASNQINGGLPHICKYSALSIYRRNFSLTISRKTVRASYGVSFVRASYGGVVRECKLRPKFYRCNCHSVNSIIALQMTAIYRESIVSREFTCPLAEHHFMHMVAPGRETLYVLLALCGRNPSFTGGFSSWSNSNLRCFLRC